MIKKILKLFVILFLAIAAYLAFWPVPVDPVAWDAPASEGYTGQFSQNTDLANLDKISIGEHHGPEDVAGRMEDGRMIVYVSTQSGDILRIDPEADTHEIIANTGGVALGVQFDANGNLIIADAHKGLLSMDTDLSITVLTDTAEDGSPIAYAD